MKKIFFLLAIILAFSVTSCKQANVESTEDVATDTTEVTVPSADTTSVDTTAVDTVK